MPKVMEAGHRSMVGLFHRYKRGARARAYDWDLTKEQFKTITCNPCAYCNEPPSREFTKGLTKGRDKMAVEPYTYNGIDRVDNQQGYHPNNVVACCTQCNMAKGKLDPQQFISWIRRVYAQQG